MLKRECGSLLPSLAPHDVEEELEGEGKRHDWLEFSTFAISLVKDNPIKIKSWSDGYSLRGRTVMDVKIKG